MTERTTHIRRTRANLQDVAELAGVSSSTASKILNNVPGVSVKQDTRDRVVQAAQTLGYEPHAMARALAGSRARAIAFLVPELSNPIYAQMIRGAFERSRELGYSVLITEDNEGRVSDERLNRLVKTGHVDGLLISSARGDHDFTATLNESAVPHVFVNRLVPHSQQGVSMRVREAGQLAAELFAQLGHRFLGHVSGPLDVSTSRARAEGFVETALRLGLPEPIVVNVDFDERSGATGLQTLLDLQPRTTAVFSTSINQVIGVLHQAHSLGVRVPEDLSVLAYDDLPLADFLIPPVSTIAMPYYELGREAVDAILEQIDGAPPHNHFVPIPPRIIIRQSTARAPS